MAFYDFQYVGLGLGVCDLAKFFTCSVPVGELMDDPTLLVEDDGDRDGGQDDGSGPPLLLGMGKGEEKLLRQYLSVLEERARRKYGWSQFVVHWEIALVDWLRFLAGWGFWGNEAWLKARVREIIRQWNEQGNEPFV